VVRLALARPVAAQVKSIANRVEGRGITRASWPLIGVGMVVAHDLSHSTTWLCVTVRSKGCDE